MGKLIKIFTILLFTIYLFTGCKMAKQGIIEVPVQYKERIVERLVPVELPADSANFFALLECDSTNQVIMKKLSEEKSKRVQSLFSFDSGLLKYKARTVRDTVYIAAKDSIIYEEVPIRVEVSVEVNKLTAWQIFQMWAGRLLFVLIALIIVYAVIKWKLK